MHNFEVGSDTQMEHKSLETRTCNYKNLVELALYLSMER